MAFSIFKKYKRNGTKFKATKRLTLCISRFSVANTQKIEIKIADGQGSESETLVRTIYKTQKPLTPAKRVCPAYNTDVLHRAALGENGPEPPNRGHHEVEI